MDHPNILIAAHFWDEERYHAARVCYKLMRAVDDMIDNHKANKRLIAGSEREEFKRKVDNWLAMVMDTNESIPDQVEIARIIKRFRIPFRLFEDFAGSMIFDINHNGFPTLDSFFEYSNGASVAPASIFVHLSGLTANNGTYSEPEFDVREAAYPCALFSYLVHIIRDFQKDQFNNLNYFAGDISLKYGLTGKDLRNIALGSPVSSGFRNMIAEYCAIADEYRVKTLDVKKKIGHHLEPRYRLSLEIIFDLYLMVFERINIGKGNFTTYELNPSPEETAERVRETILRFTSAEK